MEKRKNCLGAYIRKKGLNYYGLANIIGVDRHSIGDYCNGLYEPSLQNSLKIARVLDITVEQLAVLLATPESEVINENA